jgi:hypothetical protein
MKSINMPYTIINNRDEIPMIGEAYHHSRKISRPTVAVLPKKLLQGKV